MQPKCQQYSFRHATRATFLTEEGNATATVDVERHTGCSLRKTDTTQSPHNRFVQ